MEQGPRDTVADILLFCATVLIMTLYVPQIWKTYRTKNVSGFSTKSMVMRTASNLCVIGYGSLQGLPVIVASASVVVVAEVIMITLKYAYTES